MPVSIHSGWLQGIAPFQYQAGVSIIMVLISIVLTLDTLFNVKRLLVLQTTDSMVFLVINFFSKLTWVLEEGYIYVFNFFYRLKS